MYIDAMKVQVLMGRNNLNTTQLAKKSNVSRQTISCINSGKSCTPVVACKIANALEVDVTEILR